MCITAAALQALGMGASSASTAATVGSIAMGGATALSAASSLQQAGQAEETAEYNRQVLESQRLASEQKKEFDLAAHDRSTKRGMGRQRASMALSGIQMNDRQDILDESAEMAALDVMSIKYGSKIASNRARQRQALEIAQGRALANRARAQAGVTLLGGVKTGLVYLNSKKKGPTNGNKNTNY